MEKENKKLKEDLDILKQNNQILKNEMDEISNRQKSQVKPVIGAKLHADAFGLALCLVISTGICAYVGHLLDNKFLTDPYGLVVGVVLGFVAGVYQMVKQVLK